MGLEAGTYISDLTKTNPISTDKKGQGDDHLRLLKSVLQATFPNASKAFYLPVTLSKTADFAVLASHMNTTFLTDTTAGAVTYTLPTLASGDAGWECSFLKTNTGTNPFFIAPPSGTIQSGEVSGLSKTRRCIPGHKTKVLWTGTAWIAERVVKTPVGSVLEFAGTSLPVGYEWPNGTALSSSANYPDYNSVRGGLTTPDRRGRVAAGKDDMGGSSANRLTAATAQGLNGDTFEATGGEEAHTLTKAESPTGLITLTDPNHHHFVANNTTFNATLSATNYLSWAADFGGGSTFNYNLEGQTTAANVGKTSDSSTGISLTDNGSDDAHNVLQPTIIENFILVVE